MTEYFLDSFEGSTHLYELYGLIVDIFEESLGEELSHKHITIA